MKTHKLSKTILAGIIVLTGSAALQATTLVSYDAAAAGSGITPTGVSPAWSYSGGGNPQMVNNGIFLLQDNPAGAYGEYLSPSAGAGTMVFQSSNYGIQFTVQPLTDSPFRASDWANCYVTWSDNAYNYNVTIDKYTNDVGGLGAITYGRGSLSTGISGIDWSTAHTIFIGYQGSVGPYGTFDFYLDGVLANSVSAGSMARTGIYAQDAVDFGDGTSGGTEVQAKWYNISITDSAIPVPEPATLGLLGVISMAGLARLRKKSPVRA